MARVREVLFRRDRQRRRTTLAIMQTTHDDHAVCPTRDLHAFYNQRFDVCMQDSLPRLVEGCAEGKKHTGEDVTLSQGALEKDTDVDDELQLEKEMSQMQLDDELESTFKHGSQSGRRTGREEKITEADGDVPMRLD